MEFFLQNQLLENVSFEESQNRKLQIQQDAIARANLNTSLGEEERKNIILKSNNAIRAIEDETAQARIQAANSVAASFDALAEIAGKQTEVGKALAIASTIISTYAAAQAAYYQTLASLTFFAPGVATVIAAINAGIAVAQGLMRVKKIQEIQVPAFADSGIVMPSDGIPIRRNNGDNRLATVKVGEVILNERHQRALGGAKTFRNIGVPGFADGGLVGQNIVNNGNADLQNLELANSIRNMQLAVSVQEITTVQNRLKLFETLSTI